MPSCCSPSSNTRFPQQNSHSALAPHQHNLADSISTNCMIIQPNVFCNCLTSMVRADEQSVLIHAQVAQLGAQNAFCRSLGCLLCIGPLLHCTYLCCARPHQCRFLLLYIVSMRYVESAQNSLSQPTLFIDLQLTSVETLNTITPDETWLFQIDKCGDTECNHTCQFEIARFHQVFVKPVYDAEKILSSCLQKTARLQRQDTGQVNTSDDSSSQ